MQVVTCAIQSLRCCTETRTRRRLPSQTGLTAMNQSMQLRSTSRNAQNHSSSASDAGPGPSHDTKVTMKGSLPSAKRCWHERVHELSRERSPAMLGLQQKDGDSISRPWSKCANSNNNRSTSRGALLSVVRPWIKRVGSDHARRMTCAEQPFAFQNTERISRLVDKHSPKCPDVLETSAWAETHKPPPTTPSTCSSKEVVADRC